MLGDFLKRDCQVDTIWPQDARGRMWFVYIFPFFRVVAGYVKRRGRSGVTKNFFEREVIRIIYIHAFRYPYMPRERFMTNVAATDSRRNTSRIS